MTGGTWSIRTGRQSVLLGVLALVVTVLAAWDLPHDESIVSSRVHITNSPPAIAVLVVEVSGWALEKAAALAFLEAPIRSEHPSPNGVLPLWPGAEFGQRQARALWEAVKSAWDRVTGRMRAPPSPSRALCNRPDMQLSVYRKESEQCPVGTARQAPRQAPHPVRAHANN